MAPTLRQHAQSSNVLQHDNTAARNNDVKRQTVIRGEFEKNNQD
jgi:hypothetical protein